MTKLERDFQGDVGSIRNWYIASGINFTFAISLICDLITEYDAYLLITDTKKESEDEKV